MWAKTLKSTGQHFNELSTISSVIFTDVRSRYIYIYIYFKEKIKPQFILTIYTCFIITFQRTSSR